MKDRRVIITIEGDTALMLKEIKMICAKMPYLSVKQVQVNVVKKEK